MPYIITLNNSARTYREQLDEYEAEKGMSDISNNKNTIFISHRSTDKDIADMLVDFFSGTGIPKSTVFCSSLPGNDINEKISDEVKAALKNSALNIAILSQDYYDSVYCLNEAGILWYEDTLVIPIALPEINPNNMFGFLNGEYKLRRLDTDTDVAYIYDTASKAVSAPQTKNSIITQENNKLRTKYKEYIEKRAVATPKDSSVSMFDLSQITTDDEKIVLYYLINNSIRKVSKDTIQKWINENELYEVNIDNAFDLLASIEGGSVVGNTLEFGIKAFREYSSNSTLILKELQKCVDQHQKRAIDTFKSLWNRDDIEPIVGLFLSYIVDEKIKDFGDRWMAETQIESIKEWELKNQLYSELSRNYGRCLAFFVENNLVYPSGWTSYGNIRTFSLCPSLQSYLFACPQEIINELEKNKSKYHFDVPF